MVGGACVCERERQEEGGGEEGGRAGEVRVAASCRPVM